MSTAAEQTSATDTLVERFGLKALVESYHSPVVKKFVEEKFGGAVLAGW